MAGLRRLRRYAIEHGDAEGVHDATAPVVFPDLQRPRHVPEGLAAQHRGHAVVEQVFALPGIGQLMINSIFQRDFPVMQAVTLVFAVMVVLVYLATDIVHALLDPRVRFD